MFLLGVSPTKKFKPKQSLTLTGILALIEDESKLSVGLGYFFFASFRVLHLFFILVEALYD